MYGLANPLLVLYYTADQKNLLSKVHTFPIFISSSSPIHLRMFATSIVTQVVS